MIYIILFIIAFLVFVAGYLNGWMDWIKSKKLDVESWKRKWKWFPVFKNGDGYTKSRDPYKKKWYYFGLHKPDYIEAYAYSSTILVFLTDSWHNNKFWMFLCYEIAIMFTIIYYERLSWWWLLPGVIILKAIRGLGFTLKYDKK